MAPKKRKDQDNTSLYVGIGVGVSFLVLLLIGGIVAVVVATRANEPVAKAPLQIPEFKPPPPPPTKPQINKDKVDIGDKTRITNGVRARADRPERLNELRQIALFYVQYRDSFNKPPATTQDFIEYIKRDSAAIKQALDEKYFVLLPNVRGNGIVAYERDPDQNGRHGVVTASAAPDDMTTQELIDAVKAQGN